MQNWFKIIKAESADQPAEILIYDQIGKDWFDGSGVNAAEFANALKELDPKQQIVVAINSPGGNVFDGLAIYHQLQARKQYVRTRVDGVAASIASVIALAGREVSMPENALMMIHDPSGIVMGGSEEMRRMADQLDFHANNLAAIYASKAGGTIADWRAAMKEETWYTGKEAVSARLADKTFEATKMAAHFDFSKFRRVPEALRSTATKTPANSGAGKGNDTMKKAEILALLVGAGVTVANDATDQTILAELDKLVTAGKVTKEQKEKLTTMAQPITATATSGTPSNVVTTTEFQALQASLQAEKEKRITAEFDQIVANNPTIDRAEWLPLALKDESILAKLKKFPSPMADPVRAMVTNEGNPVVEKYRGMKPGPERAAYRAQHEDGIRSLMASINPEGVGYASRIWGPRNANTLAAALVTDYLSDGLITIATAKLAPLAAYSRNFGTDPMKPRATVQVNKATVGATTQTNATNFESGDSTIAAVAVSVSQLTQSFHLTNDQLNKGYQLANLAGINADTLCNAISDLVTALWVVGNYATSLVIGAVTAFDPGDLPPIFDVAKNFRQRNLLLSTGYLSALYPGLYAPTAYGIGVTPNTGAFPATFFPGVMGWDGLAMQNRFTGATANSVGFVCSPDAVAVASGLPIGSPPGEFLSMNTVNIDGAATQPGLGLAIQSCTWWSRSTRTIWASFDVMFGVAVGDGTAGVRLLSA